MADVRAAARAFIADRLDAVMDRWLSTPGAPITDLADAILSGVEVEEDRIKRLAKEEFDERAPEIRNPRAPVRITHTQPVIRLPAQPIEETP